MPPEKTALEEIKFKVFKRHLAAVRKLSTAMAKRRGGSLNNQLELILSASVWLERLYNSEKTDLDKVKFLTNINRFSDFMFMMCEE